MTQIGKAAEWVYRFCFREAAANKKSDAIARSLQIHAVSWVTPLRCLEKMNYYVHNRLLLFIDAFSFVH